MQLYMYVRRINSMYTILESATTNEVYTLLQVGACFSYYTVDEHYPLPLRPEGLKYVSNRPFISAHTAKLARPLLQRTVPRIWQGSQQPH